MGIGSSQLINAEFLLKIYVIQLMDVEGWSDMEGKGLLLG